MTTAFGAGTKASTVYLGAGDIQAHGPDTPLRGAQVCCPER
jgi:hypothetical protein